jgi:hypothetical protein
VNGGVTVTSALDGTTGGFRVITTADSHQEFDLDAMTLTQIPQPDPPAAANDRLGSIVQIGRCEAGHRPLRPLRAEGAEADQHDLVSHPTTEIRSVDQHQADKHDEFSRPSTGGLYTGLK